MYPQGDEFMLEAKCKEPDYEREMEQVLREKTIIEIFNRSLRDFIALKGGHGRKKETTTLELLGGTEIDLARLNARVESLQSKVDKV